MPSQIIKWKAAAALFRENTRCPEPPHICIYVEGKCEGCKLLSDKVKEIANDTRS